MVDREANPGFRTDPQSLWVWVSTGNCPDKESARKCSRDGVCKTFFHLQDLNTKTSAEDKGPHPSCIGSHRQGCQGAPGNFRCSTVQDCCQDLLMLNLFIGRKMFLLIFTSGLSVSPQQEVWVWEGFLEVKNLKCPVEHFTIYFM